MNPDAIFAKYGVGSTTQTPAQGTGRQTALTNSFQAAQKANQPSKGNIITRNLNSLGAAGGGILGAALAPETGGLSLLLPVAAAALGGAGGEAAKEASLGQKINPGEVGKQALLGGVADLAGQGIGKGLGKLAGLAGKAATGAGNLEAAPLEQLMANAGRTSETVSGLDSVARGQILKNAHTDAQLFTDLGIKTPEQFKAAANLTTGSNGFLNGTKQMLIAQGGPVDVSTAFDAAQAATRNITDKSVKNMVQSHLSDVFDKLGLSAGAAPLQPADPNAIFDAIQHIESVTKGLGREGNDAVLKNSLNNVKTALNGSLKSSGADLAASAYTVPAEDAAKIMADAKAAGVPKVGQHIIDSANGASNIGQIRSAEAPFVRASQVSQALPAVTAGQNAVLDAVTRPHNTFQLAYAPVRAGISKGAPIAARLSEPVLGAASKTLGAIASPTVGRGAVAAGRIAGNEASANNQVSADQPTPGVLEGSQIAQDQSASPDQNSQDQSSNAFSPEALQAMAINDIHSTGGKNIDKIATLASLFGPNGKTSSTSGTTAQKNQQLSAQNALSILDNVEQQFGQAGGGKGRLAGDLAQFGTKFNLNPNLTAYDQTLTDAATALAKAITGTARPAAAVINQYRKSLPQPTDSPATAQQKLNILRQNIGGLLGTSTTQLQPTSGGSQ